MSYSIEMTPNALEGIKRHKKSGNKPLLRKSEKLMNELTEYPETRT